MQDNKRKLRNDLILIGVLAVVLVGALLYLFRPQEEGYEQHLSVTVTVDGATFGVYPLSEDRVVDIPSESGHNRLIIQDGKAKMDTATCPDGICVAHYAIHRQGESIVCLPNKVVVTVTSKTTDQNQPDMVV